MLAQGGGRTPFQHLGTSAEPSTPTLFMKSKAHTSPLYPRLILLSCSPGPGPKPLARGLAKGERGGRTVWRSALGGEGGVAATVF